jgi:TolB protein
MDFQQVEAEYRKLKAQFDAGQLSEEELRSRVTQFVVEDDLGRWWSIGYETGQWYYHDGENWTPGTPPASAAPITSQASPAPLAPEPDKSETLEPVSLTVEPRRDGAARRNLPYLWIAGAIIIVGIFAVLLPQITGGRNNNGQMAQVSATPTEKGETGVQPALTVPPAAPPSATATPPPTDQPTATPTLTDRPTVTPTPTKPPTATASPTSRPTATSTPPQHTGRLVFTRSGKDGRGDIYTYNLQNGQLARLTKESENHIPRWAPNGAEIAFTSNTGGGGELFDIWTMTATGGDRVRKISTEGWDEYPAWAPDGKRMAFVTTEQTDGVANSEIFTFDLDAGRATRLTRNKSRDEWPTWSPDGKAIAFSSGQNGTMDIWIMNSDGTNQRAVAATAGDENQPIWSPDGIWIAFVLRKAAEDPYGDIWLVAADGGSPIRQVTKGQFASSPAWSPDGKWLVFSRWEDHYKNGRVDRGDESDLWGVRPSDGALSPLLVASGSDASPDWSR